MRRKITTYITNFFDNLSRSHHKRSDYSQEVVPFDKSDLLSKITDAIDSKESHGVKRPLYRSSWFLAASFVCILIFGYYYYANFIKKDISRDKIWITKTTKGDHIDSFTLADGSRVWLNTNSTMRYPQQFNADSREVTLNGEAFFDVVHHSGSPFIIHSGNIHTTVLGTSFDVNAYQNNLVINVTVKTGKVQVKAENLEKKHYMIFPQQQLSIHKNNHVITLQKDVNLVTAIGWKDNKLIFVDKPLKDIIPIINRKYHANIQMDSSLNNFAITADLEDETLANTLKVISIITNTYVSKTNGITYIKRKDIHK